MSPLHVAGVILLWGTVGALSGHIGARVFIALSRRRPH